MAISYNIDPFTRMNIKSNIFFIAGKGGLCVYISCAQFQDAIFFQLINFLSKETEICMVGVLKSIALIVWPVNNVLEQGRSVRLSKEHLQQVFE